MAKEKVYIGRIWPVMPTCVRITVGTHEEMEQFQAALQKVMRGTTAFSLQPESPGRNARRSSLLLERAPRPLLLT